MIAALSLRPLSITGGKTDHHNSSFGFVSPRIRCGIGGQVYLKHRSYFSRQSQGIRPISNVESSIYSPGEPNVGVSPVTSISIEILLRHQPVNKKMSNVHIG